MARKRKRTRPDIKVFCPHCYVRQGIVISQKRLDEKKVKVICINCRNTIRDIVGETADQTEARYEREYLL